MNADDKIRRILEAQVDSIEPSPAGWDRIRDGIVVRRRRRLWLRSSTAATVALSLVAVVAVQASRDDTADRPNRLDIASQPESPDESSVPVPDSTTSIAIWPLTTEAEVQAWKRDPAGYEFLGDKGSTALHFAREYLGLTAPMLDTSGERIEVRRRADGAAQPLYVGTLDITGGGERPYLVRSMSADGLSVVAPQPTEVLGRVVRAHGNFAGVDQVVDVELRSSPASGSAVLARTRATTGAEGWEATLEYASSGARTGSLLVTTDSGLDGGLAASVAIPIAFAPHASPAPTAATTQPRPDGSYPARFVAVENGRIGLYDTRTGKRVRFLTDKQSHPEGGASEPSVVDDGRSVVYVHGEGTCSASIREITLAWGRAEVLVPSTADRIPSAPAVSGDGLLAYVSTPCDPEGAPTELVVGAKRLPLQARSPDTSGIDAIAWSPEGDRVAVIANFCCAQDHVVYVVDPAADRSVDEGEDLGSPPGECRWVDLMYAPDGRLLVAEACVGMDDGDAQHSRIRDVRGRADRPLLATPPRDWIGTADVDSTGDHILFTAQSCGETCEHVPDAVYRFSVDGEPVKLADGLTQPSWVE